MTCRAGLRGLLRGAPPEPGHESAVAAPAATCASSQFYFVAGAHFQPYMSVPTGPTWGGAGPVSRVSRDSLILTLYHGRDRSAGLAGLQGHHEGYRLEQGDHGCPSACWLGGYTHVRLEMSAGYKGKA